MARVEIMDISMANTYVNSSLIWQNTIFLLNV